MRQKKSLFLVIVFILCSAIAMKAFLHYERRNPVVPTTYQKLLENSQPKEREAELKNSSMEDVWEFVYKKQYVCKNEDYLGGNLELDEDGAYYLCKDENIWPFPTQSSHPCLVYSFGISWDFKFDDAIAKLGCEVHAFDPSMDLAEGTRRDAGVIFHKIGIGEQDTENGFKGWKLRTLRTLMKELGHQNRTLDYLKVDTDRGDGTGFEDTIMKEMLETGMYKCVRQLGLEIHMLGPKSNSTAMDRCNLLYSQLKGLEKGGFRLYQTVDNVRHMKSINPKIDQNYIKRMQSIGHEDAVLWESHFVNIDFKGSCKDYI